MMELVQAKGNTYYFDAPAKAGLCVFGGSMALLVDSGNDKDAGKRILHAIEGKGLTLSMICNTHSHADHIGGNAYLQGKTGCDVLAMGSECDFTNHPLLEPSLLYSAAPPKPLRHKFLLAAPSVCEPLTPLKLPQGFSLLPLGGHAPDMVGIRTPDDVLFIGDALASRETLDKYRVGYIYDVGAYLDTLARLREVKAALFIPAHAAPTEDLSDLIDYNIAATEAVAEDILAACGAPETHERILKALFDKYGLPLNFAQFALVGSTVRAYLAWLLDTGRVTASFENNLLLWQRI